MGKASYRGDDQALENLCASSRLLQEFSLLKFLERLLELLLRVHHNRSVPCHWLFQWFSRDQEESDSVFPGLHAYFVAAIKEDERAIVGVDRRRGIQPFYGFRRHGERTGSVAEFAASAENIGEGVASRFHG